MDSSEVRGMRAILASEPIAIFHVVHYGNQVCAEVDPSFVLQFWNELGSLWHIIDYVGIYNIIWYNKFFYHPLINPRSWRGLQHFYSFPNNVDVTFAYYGHRSFSMIEFKEISGIEHISPFHSRSTFPSETTWFDINLTDTMINKTKLLLPQSFGEYVRFYSFDELKVCTDDGRANKF
ncbi:hypothetical protein P8452_41826 [Trifolium repens]|nr:hypothetical protein P8452_41826 [Trifolium repens]